MNGIVKLVLIATLAGALAACGSRGPRVDPRLGVAPSPRVVADGQPIPRGGGREMVGQPYTIGGRTFVPRHDPSYSSVGIASWYGDAFHGRLTANGEVFDREALSAAHPTLPLPSYVRVSNLENGRSIVVRVNDRGPFVGQNRTIDVSRRVAETLAFRRDGLARVRVEYVGPAGLAGSDDRVLMASLRTDGRPAPAPGGAAPTLVASAPSRPAAPSMAAPTPPARHAGWQAPEPPRTAALPGREPPRPPAALGASGFSTAPASPLPAAGIGLTGIFFAPPTTPPRPLAAPFAGLTGGDARSLRRVGER